MQAITLPIGVSSTIFEERHQSCGSASTGDGLIWVATQATSRRPQDLRFVLLDHYRIITGFSSNDPVMIL